MKSITDMIVERDMARAKLLREDEQERAAFLDKLHMDLADTAMPIVDQAVRDLGGTEGEGELWRACCEANAALHKAMFAITRMTRVERTYVFQAPDRNVITEPIKVKRSKRGRG